MPISARHLKPQLRRQLFDNDASLTVIRLRGKHIDSEEMMILANGLRQNTTVTHLYLGFNNIRNEGVKALAEDCIRHNETLTHLSLVTDRIGKDGAEALAEAVSCNVTLTHLYLVVQNIDNDAEEEIEIMTRWNRVGALCPNKLMILPQFCKDRFVFILLILTELPISEYVHGNILRMLKVRDIVEDGNDVESILWICRDECNDDINAFIM